VSHHLSSSLFPILRPKLDYPEPLAPENLAPEDHAEKFETLYLISDVQWLLTNESLENVDRLLWKT